MRKVELRPVPKNKIGRIIQNGIKLEPHEYETILHLASLGFDVELVVPSNIPHTYSPDLEMLGTFWEMKGPESPDEKTIIKKFRKAKKQSGGRAIYDLRKARDAVKIENFIMKLFKEARGMRRLIIIEKDKKTFDIIK